MHTNPTPNPLALKFVLDGPVVLEGQFLFSAQDQEAVPVVIEEILSLPGVDSVFLVPDFITITKIEAVSWTLLESIILSILAHHSGDFPLTFQPSSSMGKKETVAWSPPNEEIKKICDEIEEILQGKIRPAVEADGGLISLMSFEEGVVYVQLQGACSGCPHSQETLKSGIEQTLRYYIPEVKSVEAV